jgi:hypothetical protein
VPKETEARVQAECTPEGWFFSADGQRLGPFSLKDLDVPSTYVAIAEKLGVEPYELRKAQERCYERPMTLSELSSILGITVKRDEVNKLITFLGMLLAQTEEDQFNIAFQAESSTGKSYIPLEIVEYFPESERRIYAGASPTSFFHEVGQWDKERGVIRVDLEGKILIFMDQPHWDLIVKLRPLLSHDRKVLTYKITDKREKGGLRTKTVELVGYPTVVFCTARPTQEEQERTRLWLLSPESSQEKIREALLLLAEKEGNRELWRQKVLNDPMRAWLKARVERIRFRGIRNIVIPNSDEVLRRFLAGRTHLKPRDQRDFPRLMRLIKAIALLNHMHRQEVAPFTIAATPEDVEEGFKLYEMLAPSNELGLSPFIYEIYQEVIKPLGQNGQGIRKKDILRAFRDKFHRPLEYRKLRDDILPTLEGVGLITMEPDPQDRREKLVYPTDLRDISETRAPAEATASKLNAGDEKNVPDISGVKNVPDISGVPLPCVACGKPTEHRLVRNGTIIHVHEECEEKWPGKL